jgi:hypothetical protein
LIFNTHVHIAKSAAEVAPQMSELLGVEVTAEQVDTIKALLYGEEIALRTRNVDPALYIDKRLKIEDFEAYTEPNLDGKDVVIRLRKRPGPNND